MLVFGYGIDSETAFELLQQPSRHHDLTLHDVAEQVRNDMLSLFEAQAPIDPLTLDCLLFTVHHRIAHARHHGGC